MEQGSAWMEQDGGAQNLKNGRNRGGRKLLIPKDIKTYYAMAFLFID
jgi:hypothetical protein